MSKIETNSVNMYSMVWRDPVRWIIRFAAVAILVCDCVLPFVSTKDGFWYNAVSIYVCLACSLPQVAFVGAMIVSFLKLHDKYLARISAIMCYACVLSLLLRFGLVIIGLTDCDFSIHWGFYASFVLIAAVAVAVIGICFRQGRIMLKNNKYYKAKASLRC